MDTKAADRTTLNSGEYWLICSGLVISIVCGVLLANFENTNLRAMALTGTIAGAVTGFWGFVSVLVSPQPSPEITRKAIFLSVLLISSLKITLKSCAEILQIAFLDQEMWVLGTCLGTGLMCAQLVKGVWTSWITCTQTVRKRAVVVGLLIAIILWAPLRYPWRALYVCGYFGGAPDTIVTRYHACMKLPKPLVRWALSKTIVQRSWEKVFVALSIAQRLDIADPKDLETLLLTDPAPSQMVTTGPSQSPLEYLAADTLIKWHPEYARLTAKKVLALQPNAGRSDLVSHLMNGDFTPDDFTQIINSKYRPEALRWALISRRYDLLIYAGKKGALTLPQMSDAYVSISNRPLLYELLRSHDPTVRIWALENWTPFKSGVYDRQWLSFYSKADRDDAGELMKCLKDEDVRVRITAYRTLLRCVENADALKNDFETPGGDEGQVLQAAAQQVAAKLKLRDWTPDFKR